MAKATSWTNIDAEVRKRGEQTGLDTLVVHAVSTAARLKLKGIDGGPHKRWSMWFNSMQREEPYLPLTLTEPWRDPGVPSGLENRCCMAVVSSCREMLG